jgi:hypothetical protein
MTLISSVQDILNGLTWANMKTSVTNMFTGYMLGQFTITTMSDYMIAQNALVTKEGYSKALETAQICEMLGLSNASIIQQTIIALNGIQMFTGYNTPYSFDYSGLPYFLVYHRHLMRAFKWAKDLGQDLTKWDASKAFNDYKILCDTLGLHPLAYKPPNLYWWSGRRYYDEWAEGIDICLKLFEVDPTQTAIRNYAVNDMWANLITTHWDGTYFGYGGAGGGYEGEAGFFYLVIGRLRALNNMTLPNWANILTDIHNRFLINGWLSPQWTTGSTSYYCVIHAHDMMDESRVGMSVGAWVSLNAFYHLLPSADQVMIQQMLYNATSAWQYLMSSSRLYNATTKRFRWVSSTDVYTDDATAMACVLMLLQGIVPSTGSLFVPLYEWFYEDEGGCLLNKYFHFDLTNHVITIPVKAGTLTFIYGTTPVTYNFPFDGCYTITFDANWNSIVGTPTRNDLDTSLLWLTQPVNPPPVTHYNVVMTNHGGGSTTPASGTTVYSDGDTVNVSATPDGAHDFDYWIDNGVTITQQDYSFVIHENHTIDCYFKSNVTPPTRNVNMSKVGNGTISPTAGDHVYDDGDTVTVTAQPDANNIFSYLMDGVVRINSVPYVFTIHEDHVIIVYFSPISGYHNVTMINNGGGSTTPTAGDHTYNDSDSIAVVAVPDSIHDFDYWLDNNVRNNSQSYVFIIHEDHVIIANFKLKIPYVPLPKSTYMNQDIFITGITV